MFRWGGHLTVSVKDLLYLLDLPKEHHDETKYWYQLSCVNGFIFEALIKLKATNMKLFLHLSKQLSLKPIE